MKITPKFAAVLSVTTLIFFVGINAFVVLNTSVPPKIQGVIIPSARVLPEFRLVDHHNQPFSNAQLRGTWFLLAYGFTDCPDVCPTILNTLAMVEKRLQASEFENSRVLFYTIDPQRDTPEHLAAYLGFFSKNFIGLSRGETFGKQHLPFEKSLGLIYSLDPMPADEAEKHVKGYTVSHGVYLYLFNPQGQLQAILKPKQNSRGTQVFSADDITRDVLAVRDYFG